MIKIKIFFQLASERIGIARCHVSRIHLESIRKIQFDGENIRDFVGASIKGGKWNPDRVDGVGDSTTRDIW